MVANGVGGRAVVDLVSVGPALVLRVAVGSVADLGLAGRVGGHDLHGGGAVAHKGEIVTA